MHAAPNVLCSTLHDGRPLLPPLLVSRTSPPSIPARPALAPWCRVVEDGRRVLVEHGGTLVTLEGRAAGTPAPGSAAAARRDADGRRAVDAAGRRASAPGRRPRARVLARASTARRRARRRSDGGADASSAASYAASVTRRISAGAARWPRSRGASVAVVGSGRQARRGRAAAPPAPGSDTWSARPGTTVPASDAPRRRGTPAATTRRCCSRGQPCLRSRTSRAWLQVLPYDGRLSSSGRSSSPAPRRAGRASRCAEPRAPDTRTTSTSSTPLPLRATAPTPLLAVAAGLAATLALRWLTAADPSLPGRFHALEARVTRWRLVAPCPARSALPRLRSVRAGRAVAVVRGDGVSATAVAGFTPLDEALRRLEGSRLAA